MPFTPAWIQNVEQDCQAGCAPMKELHPLYGGVLQPSSNMGVLKCVGRGAGVCSIGLQPSLDAKFLTQKATCRSKAVGCCRVSATKSAEIPTYEFCHRIQSWIQLVRVPVIHCCIADQHCAYEYTKTGHLSFSERNEPMCHICLKAIVFGTMVRQQPNFEAKDTQYCNRFGE